MAELPFETVPKIPLEVTAAKAELWNKSYRTIDANFESLYESLTDSIGDVGEATPNFFYGTDINPDTSGWVSNALYATVESGEGSLVLGTLVLSSTDTIDTSELTPGTTIVVL